MIEPELASEDLLRLNVLVANARAIRFDDHKLVVYGRGDDDYEVRLNPRGNTEAYVKKVREFLSTASFGAPRRYPKYIHRWASMGQINNVPVDKLLMLGEPDAVMAIAHARELTDQQAALAWWAWPSADLARALLTNPRLRDANLTAELVSWLLEFLPFETESSAILGSTRLLLQSGVLSDAQRLGLWNKGQRRKAFRIAFLQACPLVLPVAAPPHPARQAGAGVERDPAAALVDTVLSPEGQAFAQAAAECLGRCTDQDEVNALLGAIGEFFSIGAETGGEALEPEQIKDRVRDDLAQGGGPVPVSLISERGLSPAFHEALLCLGLTGEGMTTRLFSSSDATGTVLRKQMADIIGFIEDKLRALQN